MPEVDWFLHHTIVRPAILPPKDPESGNGVSGCFLALRKVVQSQIIRIAVKGEGSMQLFPEEKEIRSFMSVTLTSHRLWRESSESSEYKAVKAIMLEDLCSCTLEYESKPMWLWLAIAAGAVGLLAAISNPREFGVSGIVGGLVGGVIFYLIYRGSKTQDMELSSAVARIIVSLPGDDMLPAKQFIEATLAAKNSRYLTPRLGDTMARGA